MDILRYLGSQRSGDVGRRIARFHLVAVWLVKHDLPDLVRHRRAGKDCRPRLGYRACDQRLVAADRYPGDEGSGRGDVQLIADDRCGIPRRRGIDPGHHRLLDVVQVIVEGYEVVEGRRGARGRRQLDGPLLAGDRRAREIDVGNQGGGGRHRAVVGRRDLDPGSDVVRADNGSQASGRGLDQDQAIALDRSDILGPNRGIDKFRQCSCDGVHRVIPDNVVAEALVRAGLQIQCQSPLLADDRCPDQLDGNGSAQRIFHRIEIRRGIQRRDEAEAGPEGREAAGAAAVAPQDQQCIVPGDRTEIRQAGIVVDAVGEDRGQGLCAVGDDFGTADGVGLADRQVEADAVNRQAPDLAWLRHAGEGHGRRALCVGNRGRGYRGGRRSDGEGGGPGGTVAADDRQLIALGHGRQHRRPAGVDQPGERGCDDLLRRIGIRPRADRHLPGLAGMRRPGQRKVRPRGRRRRRRNDHRGRRRRRRRRDGERQHQTACRVVGVVDRQRVADDACNEAKTGRVDLCGKTRGDSRQRHRILNDKLVHAAAVRPGERDDPPVAHGRTEARGAFEYADKRHGGTACDKGRGPVAAVTADQRQAIALRRRRKHGRSRDIDKIREILRDGRLDLGGGRAGHVRHHDREAPADAVRTIQDQRPFLPGDRRGVEHARKRSGRTVIHRVTADRLDRELRREDGARQVAHQNDLAIAGRGEAIKDGCRNDGRRARLVDLHRPDFVMSRRCAGEVQGHGRGGGGYLIDDLTRRVLESGGDKAAGAGNDEVGGDRGADAGVVAGTGVDCTGQARHQDFQHFLRVVGADRIGQGLCDFFKRIDRRIDGDRMGPPRQRDRPYFAGKRVAEEVYFRLGGDRGGGLRSGG